MSNVKYWQWGKILARKSTLFSMHQDRSFVKILNPRDFFSKKGNSLSIFRSKLIFISSSPNDIGTPGFSNLPTALKITSHPNTGKPIKQHPFIF